MGVLAEDLVESIIDRTLLPVAASTFDTPTILRMASEELKLGLVSRLLAARENFYLTYVRVPIVQGQAKYALPERAIGTGIKDFWFVDANGHRKRYIPRTDTRYLTQYSSTETGTPRDFLLFGDEMMLLPTPGTAGGFLEFWYYRRPSQLIVTTSCALVSSISSGSSTVTFTTATDLTASIAVGAKMDAVSGKSPYFSWADDVEVVSITATTIELTKAPLLTDAGTLEVSVGDYLCPAQFSCIPMIPAELNPILAQATAVQMLDSMGHMEKATRAEGRLQRMIDAASPLIANRVESQLEVIRPTNSILEAAQGGYGTGRGGWPI